MAADFFAAFFVGVVLAALFTAFFASFLAGDFFKASATEPIAVLTVPATSSAIARPYPTFSAAFSTNVLFAIFGPPAIMFVRSHEFQKDMRKFGVEMSVLPTIRPERVNERFA